ncbi:hypothetical protein CR152_29950 [Massilia violaceinigra]|uniref:Uncharacterized protein n=2 Tax=Massilia violaceinigra TaxID=2045208 RepID=A0A2D2DTH7_9BURK|nr:hypothetical protein CR152_29950 [Massilia violaceinigra]
MEGAFRNLKIDGDKLNDIALFATEDHYEYFFITKLVVDYIFEFAQNKVLCTVIYNFDRIKTAERIMSAPFMYSVDRLTSIGNSNVKASSGIRQQVADVVRAKVNILFEDLCIKTENAVGSQPVVA